MELRHLRYFIAVAEEGSFSVAAEKRLHTAQPSLSRQIRDLEFELGVSLFVRGARGVDLTTAGKVFLDQARLALLQVEAAGEAARRAVQRVVLLKGTQNDTGRRDRLDQRPRTIGDQMYSLNALTGYCRNTGFRTPFRNMFFKAFPS
jgi:DNA-binding transcriptional LysR family regulator